MSLVTQSWLGSSLLKERQNPYGLYAVSNLGSFAALLSYPFLFERYWTSTEQLQIWRVLYLVLVFGNLLAWGMIKTKVRQSEETAASAGPVSTMQMLRWLVLGGAGVVMFLSVTNIITYEIAPVPLLWVIPLGIYLMAFVLNFKNKPWCPSWIVRYIGPIIGMQAMLYFLALKLFLPDLIVIALLCIFLFLICMYVQHQLIQSKPLSTGSMTLFYVIVSLGGFLGGILTSWIIPLASNTLIEFLVGLLLVAIMIPQATKGLPLWKLGVCLLLVLSVFFVWPHFVTKYHLWSFVLLWVTVWVSFLGLASDKKYLAVVLAGIILATPSLESIWQNAHFIIKKKKLLWCIRDF